MNALETGNRVLDSESVSKKITRIAFQIYENNFKEKSIVIAGIDGQGYALSKLIANELKKISKQEVKIVKVALDKFSPQQSEVVLDADIKEIRKKCVVLVDDVLNTGRTLAYGMKPFLSTEVKKIEVAVLVNRSNTLFPITPTYTGYVLATTLTDHVEVVLGKNASVYLK
jgi:pyrimidine operon attenuation protein/uracil phosphoribosyltransferase